MTNTNHEQFRHSAQTKKDAACDLIKGKRAHPAPAVYLSHVALECALKVRILRRSGARHIDDLKRFLPENEIRELFAGATGHNLHHLARTATVKRYLETIGESALLEQREWSEMAGDRPYSLRYGTETLKIEDAKRQVDFAAKLADLILKGTA